MNFDALKLVEQELNALTAPGSPLHRHSPWATYDLSLPLSADRLRFQTLLIDEFMADGQADIEKDGRAAVIVTAGPPGAGKSAHIRDLNLAGSGWRVIDSDEIKKKLLAAPWPDAHHEDEIQEFLSTKVLDDGHPIMKNELSSLVHNESVELADHLIRQCLEAQENVVIEGTLSWEGLLPRYLKLLNKNEYDAVTVLDVEVDQATALHQAFTRWAEGRMETIKGNTQDGGRFTPAAAITALYDSTGRFTKCNHNAVDFFNAPGAAGFEDLKLIVCTGPEPENRNEYHRVIGEFSGPRPLYL